MSPKKKKQRREQSTTVEEVSRLNADALIDKQLEIQTELDVVGQNQNHENMLNTQHREILLQKVGDAYKNNPYLSSEEEDGEEESSKLTDTINALQDDNQVSSNDPSEEGSITSDTLSVSTIDTESKFDSWHPDAEYRREPETDCIPGINHPAYKHVIEVNPTGLHKKVFNAIAYADIIGKKFDSDHANLVHVTQNHSDPSSVRDMLSLLMNKFMPIYGNIGSIAKALEQEIDTSANGQTAFANRYATQSPDLVPNVL